MTAKRLQNRSWMHFFPWIAAVLALMPAASVGAAASFPFRVARSIQVSAAGVVHAMAFAADGSVVYLATGHAITAYDAQDGKPRVAQSYPGEVTGLAASANDHALYVLTKSPSRLLAVDPHTLRVKHRKALRDPDPGGVLENANVHSIYVSGATSHAITRFSAQALKVQGSVRLAGTIGQIVDNGRGRMYAVVPRHAGVVVIDARTMQRLGVFATPACSPTGALALDPVGRRLFIGCMSGQVAILDTDMGFIFRRVQLGTAAGTHAVFAFHPAAGSGWKGGMFASVGRHIEAVRMDAFVRYGYGGSMTLPGKARALALSPDARQLWTVMQPAASHDTKEADTKRAGQARILVLSSNGGRP